MLNRLLLRQIGSMTAVMLLAVVLTTACDNDDDKLPQAANGDSNNTANNLNRNSTKDHSEYGRLEFPHISNDANTVVLIRRVPDYGVNYCMEYDKKKRAQRWTCWQWYRGNSGTSWKRNNWDSVTDNEWAVLNKKTYGWGDPFQPDPDLEPGERTELQDYYGIPYQRGHICASSDRLNSRDANEQTFYLSNIMPQTSALNEGIWNDMETQVQAWGRNDKFRRTMYVIKGGTIDEKNIKTTTSSGLIVPKYFFMALLCEDNDGKFHAMGFWVEHTSQTHKGEPLQGYAVNIDRLESLTGIDFFCNLPDDIEQQVQSTTLEEIKQYWKL